MKNTNPGTGQGADPRKAATHFSPDELIALANPKPAPEQDFAVRMRERLVAKKIEDADRLRQARDESALFYLDCDRCQMPALYFTRHPGNGDVLFDLDWFSELKPMGRKWNGTKIYCQSCNTKVRAFYLAGGGFVPNGRYIRRIEPEEDGVADILLACGKVRESMKAVKA